MRFSCEAELNVSTPFRELESRQRLSLNSVYLISNTSNDLQANAAEHKLKDLISNLFTMGTCPGSVVPHFPWSHRPGNKVDRVQLGSWKCSR